MTYAHTTAFLARPVVRQSLVFAFFLALAWLITFPAILTPMTRVMGGTTGDNFEMLRNIWWYKFALQHGQPLYYQTYLGYPEGFSSLILAANQLQYLPAYLFAFIMPLTLAYNLTVWLTMALNGWAMWILARDLLGEDIPALFTGIVFASAPTLQGHLFEGHAGLMVIWTLPLFVWALMRFLRAETQVWRWGLATIVLFNLTPSGHLLQTIYVLMPLLAMVLLYLLWQGDARPVRRLIVVCSLAGGFMLLFLLPMIRDTLATSAYTEAGGVVRYSADLLAILTPSPFSPIWRVPWSGAVLGTNIAEGNSYIGIGVALLALIGMVRFPSARWWGLLALIAWVLSLGSLLKAFNQPVTVNLGDYVTYVPLPWAFLQDITGFSLARTPGRFNFTQAFAVALLAGYGMCAVWTWSRTHHLAHVWRYGGLVLLTAAILLDTLAFAPFPARDTTIPSAVYALRTRDDIRAVFSVPWDHLLAAKDSLYLQTAHEKPLIAGQVTRTTPVNPAKLNVLQATLAPGLLRAAGADVVIYHKDRAAESGQTTALERQLVLFGAPFYEDATIALYNVPIVTQAAADALEVDGRLTNDSVYTKDFYASTPGWFDFTATTAFIGEDAPFITLVLDNVPFQTIRAGHALRLPIPVSSAGYHRLSLHLQTPCPTQRPPMLLCKGFALSADTLTRVSTEYVRPLIPYAQGITLSASDLQTTPTQLTVRLNWSFAADVSTSNSVRFVHVLDADGKRVAQFDSALSDAAPARSQWLETLTLNLTGLPVGEYSVRVGWYAYPSLERFTVLDDTLPGAADNAPEIATFRVQ